MRAAVYTRYGEPEAVLRIGEAERPVPGVGEVLIGVRAAAVNPLDARLMKGRPAIARLAFGLLRPKLTRPGVDVAGMVEAVGPGVTRFAAGDAVFGSCRGAFADFACARETDLAEKPAGVSFEQAAAVPVAGYTALQGLRGRVRPGQRVLVNGASGGVGSFAVQIARAWGASVTGVCSTRNLDRVRSIGAERAIDYSATDFLRGGERYDVIFDAAGNLSLPACKRILEPGGILIAAGGGVGPSPRLGSLAARLLGGLLLSRFGSRKLAVCMAKRNGDDLAALAGMLERGEIVPLIDRLHPLDQAAEAVAYVAGGHARGKVVVTCPLTIPLIVHVGAGSIGILSGALALAARKGGRLHRASGMVFLIAMLAMSAMATGLAVQIHQRGNVVGGLFTFYLVLSGWMTVRRAPGTIGGFEKLAFVAVLALALFELASGIQASGSPGGKLEGYGAPLYYIIGAWAAFAALLDFNLIRRGGISGVPRIARHLWRMCSGLFIASGSFFIGQQKVMPPAFHGSPLLLALGVAPLALMLFWLVRVRFSKAFRPI